MTAQQKWNEQKIFAALLAVMGWTTLIMQFFYKTGPAITYFSFFTIQSNILVALTASFAAWDNSSRAGKFFNSLSVQTAVAMYIFIVGLVYNTVLRGLAVHTGWSLFLDTMLHVVMPLLYLLYWAFMRPKGNIEYRDGIYWLLFPFLYLVYSMIRGAVIGWYPYPFLNADKNGYGQVSINIAVMIAVFLIAGLILIAITRSLKKQTDQ